MQPFIENSIEHGFKSIDYGGILTISLREEANQLLIQIIDNGVGLQHQQAQTITPKKSLSKVIIQERLDVLFNRQEKKAWFEAGPNMDQQGWTARIHIPLIIV
ncbi:LytS family sensor histidine kinase [Niabella hibiscisoli]|uniref:hypothetical protein n=1 Tax=Niabella hibiscisoli TaxID=1825928 RepID=UPI001F0F6D29|nr:hypothetical protein [Niabella hibiscisoli]MCH5719731.1 hypothetical protein [Niabella hibiscisoli]